MNIEEIKQRILDDKNKSISSYCRYPVRFLFMEMNNHTQEDIQELVKSGKGELLDLSDYLMKKEDGWMTKTKFIHVIEKNSAKDRDTYVLGFSELIRFYSCKDIEATVLSLFDIENSGIADIKRRIIFICFSMMDNVYKVLRSSFPRKALLDPFLNSDYALTAKNRRVCFVSNDYAEHITKNKITSSVEWLGLWRSSGVLDFTIPIWCCSESLYAWHQKASPDNAFQIDVVHNAKEYLEKACDLNIGFQYSEADEAYWDQLCLEYTDMPSGKDWNDLASAVLGVDIKSINAIAGKWFISNSQYEKWFIRCYVEAFYPMSFLARVFKVLKTNSTNEYLISIWQQGYWLRDPDQLEERRGIIKELNKYADCTVPEKDIQEVIREGVSKELCIGIPDNYNASEICLSELSIQYGQEIEEMKNHLFSYYMKIFKPAFTGLSNSEKEFVINLYKNGILDRDEIRLIYPSLYSYLFGIGEIEIVGKNKLKDYLKAYRESKIADADNPFLQQYYSGGVNADNLYAMYYELPRQETLILPYVGTADIYVLDGVGAEYVPLIMDLLVNNGYEIEYCDYASCHLPSITDVNKEYLNTVGYKEWYLEFDQKVIHGEFYKATVNLRKAFDILEEKIRKIVQEAAGRKILITADHGATARAKWTETKKMYNFDKADHEGRCYKIVSKNEYTDTEDYIVYEDEGKPGNPYIIALNENSLFNRPKYENHGGATVEEMLVPVIVAGPENGQKKISYKVVGDKLEVTGLDKKVIFAIIPDPEEAFVIEFDGNKRKLIADNGMYSVELSSGREQDIKVVIADEEYKFHVVNIARKNMMGDDGFDN